METNNKRIPFCKRLVYGFDHDNGCYKILNAPDGFNKMPALLGFERNQGKGNVKTDLILRGKTQKWSDKILTGLMKSTIPGVYYGDHFNKGKKSFLIIGISTDNEKMVIEYYHNYYPLNPTIRNHMIYNACVKKRRK
jgi:hypothetical protein